MKLLIAEDDMVTGTLLKKILNNQGYDTMHVADGEAALVALQDQSFRIVITDWMMPKMNGPELCRRIRELESPCYIYTIILTARDSTSDAVTGLESGADDYITKPFQKEELLARVQVGRRILELEDMNRQTQNKLARTEKIAAVGHLAAGIAHEINNPIGFISSNLNTLKGYTLDVEAMLSSYRELAQSMERSIGNNKVDARLPLLLNKAIRLEDKSDINFVIEDMGDLIGDCTDGAKRIKDIVFEMRYFDFPETQQFSTCSLNDLLNRLVTQFETQLPLEATIENKCPPLPEIQCNIPHIEKAFENILQNSADYIEADGLISIDGTSDENTVRIGVSDNGRGIDAENISNVYNPFFTTKEPGVGIGLGLTTSLNIIRVHNGDIDVTSEPHKRTTFTVQLPIRGA